MLRYCIILCFSIIFIPLSGQDTLIPVSDSLKIRYFNPDMTSRQISMRSLMLPGWGQFTNHQFWKVPVAAGGVAAGIAGWIYFWSENKKYSRAVTLRLDGKV